MNIIAFDTASDFQNIVLQSATGIYESYSQTGFTHSENLLPEIDILCKKANISVKDIELIVCSKGPGSFTGLRIGISVAKGIAFGIGAGLVTVPTLEVYAFPYRYSSLQIIPVIDAKKQNFYTAMFYKGSRTSVDSDLSSKELSLQLFPSPGNTYLLTGPHASLLYQQLSQIFSPELFEHIILDTSNHVTYGNSLLELGLSYFNSFGSDPTDSGPTYLRKSEAEILSQNC